QGRDAVAGSELELHEAQGDILVEGVKGAPAFDGGNGLLEPPFRALQLGEPIKHLLDALVPVSALDTHPVIEVHRVAQGKILEKAVAIQCGGVLKASNQRAAHLPRHLFTCGLVAGQAPCRLQLVQVEINARVHIESERIMRNEQVGFVCWLSAFLKSATYVM